MGNTARYGWAYPELVDPPNTALHLKNLAQAVESTVGAVDDRVAALIGVEVRANANQAITASSGANKLTFGSVAQPANGVTWTGNNTATTLSAGLYSCYVSASTAFAAGNNFAVAVGGSVAPGAGVPWYSGPLVASGQTDSFTMVTRWFPAGTALCAWLYNNGSAITLNPTVQRSAEFIVWKVAG